MKKIFCFLGAFVLFFGDISFAYTKSLGSIEGTGVFTYSLRDHCSSWILDLELISNEGGMYGFGLDILGYNSYSEWSISNEEEIIIDSGTTGPMSWNISTHEIGFELSDSYFCDDLVVTGYRNGNSNRYDIINPHLKAFPIPEPATVFLIGCGFVVIIGFKRRFRKV